MADENVLEFANVSKTYNIISDPLLSQGRQAVLDNVSLTLRRGEIYGFVGLNGAGKTTTIKIAMGLVRPDTGTVKMLGKALNSDDLRRIGFAPEKPAFYDFLSAEETMKYSARLLGYSADKKRIAEVLETLNLHNDMDKLVREYSKGMQQRLALAAAMLHDPELYILDEPSSGLDPVGRRHVKDLLRNLRSKGKTVFFSTHILSDVRELCDRVGIIHNGKMLFEGTLKDLNPKGEDLEDAFIKMTAVLPTETTTSAPKERELTQQ